MGRRRHYVFDLSVCAYVLAYMRARTEAFSDRLVIDF